MLSPKLIVAAFLLGDAQLFRTHLAILLPSIPARVASDDTARFVALDLPATRAAITVARGIIFSRFVDINFKDLLGFDGTPIVAMIKVWMDLVGDIFFSSGGCRSPQ